MTRASYVRVSIMAALLGVQACGGAGTVGSGDTTSAPAAGPGGTMPPQDAPVQVMPPAPGDPNGDRLPPAPGPGTAPGSAPTPMAPDPRACGWALDHLASCNLQSATFNGVCTVYSACEATCITAASCDTLTRTTASAGRAIYQACINSCYQSGPATCDQVNPHVTACGPAAGLYSQHRGSCSPQERCLANCTIASSCRALTGTGPEAASLGACHESCLGGPALTGPLFF